MKTTNQLSQQLLTKQDKSKKKAQAFQEKYFAKEHYLFSKNVISLIIFSWISPLIQYGNKLDLCQKAVPQLRPQDASQVDFKKLDKQFSSQKPSRIQGLTLSKSILKAFKKQFILILLFSFVKTALQMYSPILSHNIIDYISNGQKSAQKNALYFCLVFITTLLLALDTSYLFFYFGVLGFNLSNTLSLLVYNKALKHPLLTQKKFTAPDIINYSQVDAQRMTYMGFQMVALLFTPVQISIGLYLLYVYIGRAFLVGTGVMVGLMAFTLVFSKIAGKFNDQLLKAKDGRMKVAQEIVQIIKFIKINALEKYFFHKLNKKREKQLKLIKKVNICFVINTFVYWLCPPLIVSATFLLYIYQGNQITAAKAFITIIIFNILQYPMRLFPTSISAFIQIWTSIKRIQYFLFASQVNNKIFDNNQSEFNQNFAVEIQHGYFLWGKQKQDQEKEKEMEKQRKMRIKREKKQKKQKNQKTLQTEQPPLSPSMKPRKSSQRSISPPKSPQNTRKLSSPSPSYSPLLHHNNNNSNTKYNNDSTDDLQNNNINDEDDLAESIISQSHISQTSSIYMQNQPMFGRKTKIFNNNQQQQKQKQKQKLRYIKALQDINTKIPYKKITMIIGDIGSGKTSLLCAILNQMTQQPMRNPKIKISGRICYAPQKPWIMSGTVKQNIVFFKNYDQNKLKKVIHYACLNDDLKLFANGIQTQIGEKGVNLSGGQRARISLARALYSDADIYLLDDVLSAVDVHVGKFLMQETIMTYLKDKTIIMPTHAVKYLQSAHNIILMKKGRILAQGSLKYVKNCDYYKQIMKHQKKREQEQQLKQDTKEQQKIINDQKIVKQTIKSFAQAAKAEQNNENNNQPAAVQVVDKVVQQLIMPQDHKIGQVSKQIYFKYIKNNGGILFVLSVIFCLSAWTVLSTISNIQIKQWCEDENKSITHLYLFLGFAISATIFSGLQSYIIIVSGINQGRTVHKQVIKGLLYSSLTKFYNRIPVGRILNRLSKDLRELDQTVGVTLGGFLVNVFCLIASLIMCVYGSTLWMIVPILVSGYACMRIKTYYLKCQRQCVRLQNITNSPIVTGFTSTITGVSTIRAYNLQPNFLNHQIQKINVNKRMKISRSAMQSWFALRLTFLSFLINMSAIGFCLLSGNQSASIVGLLLTYSTVLGDDIINVAFTFASLQLKMISVQRVTTFTQIQPQPAYIKYCQKWRTKQEGSDLQAIKQGNIEFRNYSAKYREQLPFVLRNISIKIDAGDKVGIVGRTGAGKSTLINCLFRILDPAQGTIQIDGRDILDYNIKDLRSCITMIQQQPTLMLGTFRDNLDPTSTKTDSQLLKILQQCNLLQMINLKGGLNSKISNESLSVGQKQLLCICRAFLRKSKIILIDEATANIDIKNDYLIQNIIAQKFKNSTVLTIAHRLSTLKDCNKILVLGAGKVIEWGSTIQLLGSDSIYRKMCQSNDKSYLQ